MSDAKRLCFQVLAGSMANLPGVVARPGGESLPLPAQVILARVWQRAGERQARCCKSLLSTLSATLCAWAASSAWRRCQQRHTGIWA